MEGTGRWQSKNRVDKFGHEYSGSLAKAVATLPSCPVNAFAGESVHSAVGHPHKISSLCTSMHRHFSAVESRRTSVGPRQPFALASYSQTLALSRTPLFVMVHNALAKLVCNECPLHTRKLLMR